MKEKDSVECVEFRKKLWEIVAQVYGALKNPVGGFFSISPSMLKHLEQCPSDCREETERVLGPFWPYVKKLAREILNLPMAEWSISREEVVEMLRVWPKRPTVRMDLSRWGHINEVLELFMICNNMSLDDAERCFHELAEEMEKEE